MANRPVYGIYKNRLHVCGPYRYGDTGVRGQKVSGPHSDWAKRAKELLKQTRAEDVSSAGEGAADFQKTDRPVRRAGESSSQTFWGGALAFLAGPPLRHNIQLRN